MDEFLKRRIALDALPKILTKRQLEDGEGQFNLQIQGVEYKIHCKRIAGSHKSSDERWDVVLYNIEEVTNLYNETYLGVSSLLDDFVKTGYIDKIERARFKTELDHHKYAFDQGHRPFKSPMDILMNYDFKEK